MSNRGTRKLFEVRSHDLPLTHTVCVCVCAQTVSVNKASRVQQSTGCKCGGTAHEKTSQRAEISSQLLWKQKVPCVYAGSRKLITTPCAAMSENRHSCTPPHSTQAKGSGICLAKLPASASYKVTAVNVCRGREKVKTHLTVKHPIKTLSTIQS